MDPLFYALSLVRRHRYEDASEKCSEILAKSPYDQAVWALKLRCLTEQVYVDEAENDEEGVAEAVLDESAMAQVARPGTSLNKPATGTGISPAVRPRTQTGRPITGMLRPGTQGGRPGTMEQALKTPRTARTARPVTSSTGRSLRLGTASMVSSPDGPFVNISRLNFPKYANIPSLALPLFEYLFYHENDVQNALQLASLATQACNYENWFWKQALGMCYYRLGLYRDAEKQFRSAIKFESVIDPYLHLGKVYCRMDQPLAAVEAYKQGLQIFPNDTELFIGLGRVYEGVNNAEEALKSYKAVLKQDSTNVEAIACTATHHFYSDQPEVALQFYRRLLQMGVNNAETLVNIGICCFYAQQYDMSLSCLDRAISLAQDDILPDIWYNVGLVALACGDVNMAYNSFRLAVSANADHAEAHTNLGVLEMRRGNKDTAKTYLERSMRLTNYSFEPYYNYGLLMFNSGELHASFGAVKKALDIFPEHSDSNELMAKLHKQLTAR